jgi:hypothetical protein
MGKSSLQMFFRVQGEFDHPLKEFICGQSWEILTNQFFAEQTANIAKLAAFLLAGIYEVPVSVVDYDDVLVRIEF